MGRIPDPDPSYLELSSPIITAPPFTISIYFRPTALGNVIRVWSMNDTDAAADFFLLQTNTANVLNAAINDGAGQENAFTVNTASADQWINAIGIFASATDRTSVLGGDWANRGTNTTSRTPAGLDNTVIGNRVSSVGPAAIAANFDIAFMTMWNVALNQAEVEAIGNGLAPEDIRPGNIISLVRLLRNSTFDIVGGVTFSEVSAPGVGENPPGIFPTYEGIAV